MWLLAVLALASAPPPQSGDAFIEGTAFGRRLTLTCSWFTNFENSRFEECRTPAGSSLLTKDGASIKCLGRACEELDAEARRVAHWQKPEPPWGMFTVKLVGRVSTYTHEKQYLGDGVHTVLIEKLLAVRKAN